VDVEKPLEFEQGSQFHYSQLGFEPLSKILKKITSKTLNNHQRNFSSKWLKKHFSSKQQNI
jgi:hypothetical protein